jgi:dephospho-CoA kinase
MKNVIVVNVDEETQTQRLMKRDNYNKEQAKQRIDAQMPLEHKVKKATYVIDNSGPLENLYPQLDKIIPQIRPKLALLQKTIRFGLLFGVIYFTYSLISRL